MTEEKFILDATAGFRMMWYDKHHPNTVYLDERPEVAPDIVGDFRKLSQFPDNTFYLIVFDPPHCVMSDQNKGRTNHDYGHIRIKTFNIDYYQAFKELYRVLKPFGILNFKWNSHDIDADRILSLALPWKPLFGQKVSMKTKHSSTTSWFCFMKIPETIVSTEQTGEK